MYYLDHEYANNVHKTRVVAVRSDSQLALLVSIDRNQQKGAYAHSDRERQREREKEREEAHFCRLKSLKCIGSGNGGTSTRPSVRTRQREERGT
jgi:hypothetical protein